MCRFQLVAPQVQLLKAGQVVKDPSWEFRETVVVQVQLLQLGERVLEVLACRAHLVRLRTTAEGGTLAYHDRHLQPASPSLGLGHTSWILLDIENPSLRQPKMCGILMGTLVGVRRFGSAVLPKNC